MSVHPWFDNVIGGVMNPAFLLVGENLCSNPRFSGGSDTGWTFGGSWLSSPKYIVDTNAYEEYMGRLNSTQDDSAYAMYNYNIGSTKNKKFMASFRVKSNLLNDHDITVTLQVSNGDVPGFSLQTKTVTLNKYIKKVYLYGSAPVTDFTYIGIKINNGIGIVANPDLRFDDVYICEVNYNYTMKEPQATFIAFDKMLQGENELFDGKTQEFNKRWRPNFIADWQFIESSYEEMRQRIAEADSIFVIPHIDFEWGFFAIWDGGYKREYPWDRFLGHKGLIKLRGTELLTSTIHPISIYETVGTLQATVTIGSSNPSSGITIQYEYGDPLSPLAPSGSDVTPFTLTNDSGEYLKLTAPVDNGSGDAFDYWVDSGGNKTTNRILETSMQDGATYTAVFTTTALPAGGYGTNYGSSYGND